MKTLFLWENGNYFIESIPQHIFNKELWQREDGVLATLYKGEHSIYYSRSNENVMLENYKLKWGKQGRMGGSVG